MRYRKNEKGRSIFVIQNGQRPDEFQYTGEFQYTKEKHTDWKLIEWSIAR